MMMKRMITGMLAVMLLCLPMVGLAEETAPVQLPCGVAFGMDLQEVAQAAGEGAEVEEWQGFSDEMDGTGSVFLSDAPLGIGEIQTGFLSFEVSRNNSQKEPRLDFISASVVYEGNCIAAFRKTLADLTAVYGQPDSDPFDEYARESYREHGNLDAVWTLPDTRIYLSLSQTHTVNGAIDLSFSYRLSYDLSDLDE